MKIIDSWYELDKKYQNKLKIIKKWIFWILLNEEAFFMSKYFNMKITVLDKQNIKVWFPDLSKNKWLKLLENLWLWYVLSCVNQNIEVVKNWNYYNKIYNLNLSDYNITKDRILWLNKFKLEDKNENNFLLKDKFEIIYTDFIDLLMKLPKKERYFLRESIERLFIETLKQIYNYMYNIWNRKEIIKNIFSNVMIIREFTRFLYKIGKIQNDNIFMDLASRLVDILKICKWIENKV